MNTLIINGHPRADSFSSKIAESYEQAISKTKNSYKVLQLNTLKFDPNLAYGYNSKLEPDLIQAQELITWADRLVFIYPLWWWSMPALLKGFIDRVFIPGFAFKYEGKALPTQLLKGKKATLIVTMDGPTWYYRLWMLATGHVMMKRGVLAFCGVKTTDTLMIDNYHKLDAKQKDRWLQKVKKLASL